MSTQLLDFDSFTPNTKGTGATSTGKIVFLNRKNCPASFKPVGRIYPFRSVFDAATKSNRKPIAGEKSQQRYAFNAIMPEGDVKMIVCGAQVVEGIKLARMSARNFGASPEVAVDVTCSGEGLDTTYTTAVSANRGLSAKNVDPSELQPLETTVATLFKAPEADPLARTIAQGVIAKGRLENDEDAF